MDPHGHRRRAETRASKAESRLKSSLQERRRRVIAIEMAIEIVDLPKKMEMLHSFVRLPQGISLMSADSYY